MDADVIVVGAGIIGCAVADELARRGRRVMVIDERRAGEGATQASAGILAPYIEGHDTRLLDLASRSLAMYDEFVGRVLADCPSFVEEIGYGRIGTLEVATGEAELRELRARSTDLVGRGIRCRVLDAGGARGVEPDLDDGVLGALLIEEHGAVGAGALTAALAAAAAGRGAAIVPGRQARRISQGPHGLGVETNEGLLTAPAVVLAAGSWSGRVAITELPPLPVRPIRGQLVLLDRVPRPVRHVVWGAGCYLVPRRDGRLLVGATAEDVGFDERATAAGVRDLLDAACDLVPELWQAAFAGVRVGLRPATPDGLPIIGRSDRLPGLVYATGHFRNGVLLAPLTARLVAELLDGRTSDPALAVAAPQRFGFC